MDGPLIVVGCGVAGLSAAVSALQSGLPVTLLERAPEAEFGGNSRWTEAFLRMKNDAELADDFEEVFAANAGWNIDPNLLAAAAGAPEHWPPALCAHPMPDPALVAAFADRVPPTIAWLKSFGLRFGPQPIYLLTQNTSRIATLGGGLALIVRLMAEAKALGARVLFRTTAQDLLREEATGRVTGVLATGPEGERLRLAGRAVVLASGGFQGDAEMMTRYLGARRARHIRPVAPGGYFDRGEGIRMALAAGAAPAGEYGSYHAEPVDPRARRAEAVIFVWPYGVLLNRQGERFTDEGRRTVDAMYDEVGREIADQPDGLVWAVVDGRIEDIPNWRVAVRSEVPPLESPTLEGLVAQLDLDRGRALATLAAFNAACPPPQGFEPLRLDGHATEAALAPPKSNWAWPLLRPPFRAWPVISTACFTFGGLKVDTAARVLDRDGKVMPGLYAAGETVGLYHQVYAGATSVLRGLVFGRTAGLHAAGAPLPG